MHEETQIDEFVHVFFANLKICQKRDGLYITLVARSTQDTTARYMVFNPSILQQCPNSHCVLQTVSCSSRCTINCHACTPAIAQEKRHRILSLDTLKFLRCALAFDIFSKPPPHMRLGGIDNVIENTLCFILEFPMLNTG